MASRNRRIQVPVDAEVADAIERGRRVTGQAPASQVLRTLALRGADAMERDADADADAAAREFLVSVARGTSGLDLDSLRTVRERAWR